MPVTYSITFTVRGEKDPSPVIPDPAELTYDVPPEVFYATHAKVVQALPPAEIIKRRTS